MLRLYVFILMFGISSTYASHQLAPLIGQPQTLLTQCLGAPTESWGFGSHNYLTYHVPGTTCQLIAKTKKYQITHAKLTDSQGHKKKRSDCASPALTCLGFK